MNTGLDGGERSSCSWDLCRCPAASVSAGSRLRNGGREVEESGLIIPIWPSSSQQIPDSAGRQAFMVTSGHSHLTPSKAPWPRLSGTNLSTGCTVSSWKESDWRTGTFCTPRLLKCFLSITLESLLTTVLVLKDSSWGSLRWGVSSVSM